MVGGVAREKEGKMSNALVAVDNPHQISDVACACGCDTLMTVGWMNGGKNGSQRRYLYGHAPTATKLLRSGIRKHVKSNIGPEQIEAYFAAQVEQLKANGLKLKEEAQELLAKAKAKMAQANEIDRQITQINTVREQTSGALSRIFRAAGGRAQTESKA